MRMARMGMLVLVVWILVVVGMASAGGPVPPFGNVTMVDNGVGPGGVNGAALKDLMDGSSARRLEQLGNTVEDCVEAIRRTRQYGGENYPLSFPPADFVPPGSQEWCECIVADPPKTSPQDYYTEDTRADWHRAFDRCRALVLDGSDFNTVDICRGMFDFFGRDIRDYYHSFCGTLCSRSGKKNPPFSNGELSAYYPWHVVDLNHSCGDECAREAMPGYCNKYALTYGGWKAFINRSYQGKTSAERPVAVNGVTVGEQDNGAYQKLGKRKRAMAICMALEPVLGCTNACCSYSRGFEALQICCSVDETGKAVFDCANNYGGKNLEFDCIDRPINASYYGPEACESLIKAYVSSSRHYGNAKLFTRNSDGKVMVMFPQSFIDDYYGSCDDHMQNFLANCMDASDLTYKGPAIQPLNGPLEPADCVDEPEDPCMGACEGGRQCVVSGDGVPLCVECSAMLKKGEDGEKDAECCFYDEEKMTCVSALKKTSIGKCRKSEEIFVIDDEGARVPVNFKNGPEGWACGNLRDFRRNGKGCRVKLDSEGKVVCV